jgi:hypothetical protein
LGQLSADGKWRVVVGLNGQEVRTGVASPVCCITCACCLTSSHQPFPPPPLLGGAGSWYPHHAAPPTTRGGRAEISMEVSVVECKEISHPFAAATWVRVVRACMQWGACTPHGKPATMRGGSAEAVQYTSRYSAEHQHHCNGQGLTLGTSVPKSRPVASHKGEMP